MIDFLEEPAGSSFYDLADWIEAQIVALGISRLTEITVSKALSQQGLPMAQDAVAGAIGVMRRRAAVLNDAYPFVPARGRLSYRPTDQSLCYATLTRLSLLSHVGLAGHELSSIASKFEEFSEQILASTWGDAGNALQFGWPTRSGRPRSFPLAVTWLANTLDLPEGDGYRPPERQDGGVDLVAWNRLADGSTADVRLGQCTISRDMDRKVRDIDVRLWETWVRFPSTPTVTLLIPFQVPKRSTVWVGLNERGVLVLDRMLLSLQWSANGLETAPVSQLAAVLDPDS